MQTFIIERIAIESSSRTTGRFTTASVVTIPVCPGTRIGAERIEPFAPVLFTVNVPPARSSAPSRLRRALSISSPAASAMPLIESWSAWRITGTTRLPPAAIASPMFTSRCTRMPSSVNDAFISGNAASDSTAARTKNGSSVSFTPYAFSNASFSRARHFHTLVTSTSVIVHACGAVCFDSTMRCAMILRACVSGMRSPGCAPAYDGFAVPGAFGGVVAAGAGAGGAAVDAAGATYSALSAVIVAATPALGPAFAAARMSFAVMRPLLPVPCTRLRSIRCSRARRRTAGDVRTPFPSSMPLSVRIFCCGVDAPSCVMIFSTGAPLLGALNDGPPRPTLPPGTGSSLA